MKFENRYLWAHKYLPITCAVRVQQTIRCVSVCMRAELRPKYLACWLNLTLSRSFSEARWWAKVQDHSMICDSSGGGSMRRGQRTFRPDKYERPAYLLSLDIYLIFLTFICTNSPTYLLAYCAVIVVIAQRSIVVCQFSFELVQHWLPFTESSSRNISHPAGGEEKK